MTIYQLQYTIPYNRHKQTSKPRTTTITTKDRQDAQDWTAFFKYKNYQYTLIIK